MMNPNTGQTGFTLLELLVAIAIFALVAVMAYGGLNTVIMQSAIVQSQTEQLTATQAGLRRLREDLTFAVDRPVRDALGGEVPAFTGGGLDLFSLTRLGVANPWGLPQSQMARVLWRLQGTNLQRAELLPVDGTVNASVQALDWQTQLRGVTRISLKFFDANNQAFEVWPPPNQPTAALPKATEISLTQTHLPPLRITVAQVSAWPQAQAPASDTAPIPSATDGTIETEVGGRPQ
ncbi:MAG TPA: type II secretion system minor pseudopilin GspJ [Halothiobacillus sp.]|nr:type II secretion system minor pseudopilin GspJ [Halothiobacillus sp.]